MTDTENWEDLKAELDAITPYIINFVEHADTLDEKIERLAILRKYISRYAPGAEYG